MNIVLARLGADDNPADLDGDVPPGLLIERKGPTIWIGIGDDYSPSVLTAVYTIMKWASQSPLVRESSLVWTFSSVELKVAALSALVERWDETREPPLLSIVALELGERRHVTCGMATLVGFEMAVQFDAASQSRDAARNLARLARHALMSGGIAPETIYQALDGSSLRLEWEGDQGSPDLITIVL